ncbi:MAG TPA: hypothetical protein VKB86_14025, partial [Pyrinomonadaceae bacterium]|nr:hypothetical protein [Pyrinomonadaceae bacterium]
SPIFEKIYSPLEKKVEGWSSEQKELTKFVERSTKFVHHCCFEVESSCSEDESISFEDQFSSPFLDRMLFRQLVLRFSSEWRIADYVQTHFST